MYNTRFGKIGLAICYDRHWPECMRAPTLGGAELVVFPHAAPVGEWLVGLCEAEMRVASFQKACFAALCNRVGPEECLAFAGESFVCDPAARVIARAGPGKEEILMATLDLAEAAHPRARQLFLKNRRPELYANCISILPKP